MTELRCTFPIFFHLLFLSTLQAQNMNSYFIEPNQISEEEDIFINKNKEYVFVKPMVSYSVANTLCKHNYKGRLAHVTTVELANFLAEALSETNLGINVIWIGGEYKNSSWYWTEDTKTSIQISSEITELFVDYSKSIETNDRKCLAIGRKIHIYPQLPSFNCGVSRSYMCERTFSGNDDSTHRGWIQFDKYLYKIFTEKINWENGDVKCFLHDNESSLAYVPNYYIAQQLGRHLLIGRPSLENAWIGASYVGDNYEFSKENVILPNTTDDAGYPPWLYGKTVKKYGCILLDRHLSNITNFVEARCKSPRAYICYKSLTQLNSVKDDIIIDDFGYRVFTNKLPWKSAKEVCDFYKDYEAKLVEIREQRIVDHLLYIMGENRTAFHHLWLGGLYNSQKNIWEWDSDKSPIQIEGILEWVKNNTYVESIEHVNTCLNMDRENFINPLHYGTNCAYEQHYICMFPCEKLKELQKDELEKE